TSCGSAGTPYQASLGFTSSPSCGYRYDTVSDNQPGGKFTVRATSQWTIDWTDGNAANGTVERTQTSAPVTVDVNELQSVNVGNN
ncbi:MAG: hypothetical protein JWQ43_3496, partial [Glaciihabitans sp.]|nr:hypothetical protein [Glaciihabitans sp.]